MTTPASSRHDTPIALRIGHDERVRPQGEAPRRRVHEEHIIGLLLSAEGSLQLGPDNLPLGSPLAWYLPPGEVEVLAIHGKTHGWWFSFYWPHLKITPAEGQLTITWRGQSHTIPRYKFVDAVSIARMVEIFKSLSSAMVRQDLAGTGHATGLAMQLFCFYLDLPSGLGATYGHRALERFHDLLVARLDEDVAIERLADAVSMSANHIRELFRHRYGAGPLAYRTRLRLDRARELLLSSNQSIKEVARQVGYADALYFSRIFRQHFSMSPSQLIRRYRLHTE